MGESNWVTRAHGAAGEVQLQQRQPEPGGKNDGAHLLFFFVQEISPSQHLESLKQLRAEST